MLETEFRFTDNLHSIRVATTFHFAVAIAMQLCTMNIDLSTTKMKYTVR